MQPDTRYPKQVLYTAWHFFADPSLEPKVVIDFPLRRFTVTRVIEKEHIAKITTRYFDNEEYNELLQMSECSELLRWIDECYNSKEYHKEMDYKYGYRDGWHIHCEMTLCGEPTPIQITLGGGDAPVNPFEKIYAWIYRLEPDVVPNWSFFDFPP